MILDNTFVCDFDMITDDGEFFINKREFLRAQAFFLTHWSSDALVTDADRLVEH